MAIIGKLENRNPIIIAAEPLSKYLLVVMLEFQREHDAILHATDKNVKQLENVVRLLVTAGFVFERERSKTNSKNIETGEDLNVTEVRIEKIGAAKIF